MMGKEERRVEQGGGGGDGGKMMGRERGMGGRLEMAERASVGSRNSDMG